VYEDVIPIGVANTLLETVDTTSVALQLGTTIRMPDGLERLPVITALPVAGFVNPRYGGRKPATKVEWSSEQLEPEEIACALAIPTAFVDDAGFPVWEQVRPLVSQAIARVLDAAVLFGTGAPASFPTGGVAAAAADVTGTDALEAISNGMAAIEAQGLVPNGIASSPAIGSALRAEYRSIAVPPDSAPANQLYGLPVETTPEWDNSKGDALVGDWTKLIIAVRQDIRFDTSDSAILQDTAGDIIANAFQEDLLAMRCYMRVAAVLGSPLTPDGPANAFAMADWTP
jgi:HK97 family phage major capsid protein